MHSLKFPWQGRHSWSPAILSGASQSSSSNLTGRPAGYAPLSGAANQLAVRCGKITRRRGRAAACRGQIRRICAIVRRGQQARGAVWEDYVREGEEGCLQRRSCLRLRGTAGFGGVLSPCYFRFRASRGSVRLMAPAGSLLSAAYTAETLI